MRKRFDFRAFIAGCCFFLLCTVEAFTMQPGELSGKIAFIKAGEVWISDPDGRGMEQITSDSGKVDDYLFSPSLNYLAYARIISYVDEPGLWEDSEKVPQRAVCSIRIFDPAAHKIVKEIMPTEDTWIYMSKWLPGGKLLYYSASGFDVSGYYVYDIQKDAKEEFEYNLGSTESAADYSADGSQRLYVDDSGLGREYRQNLHLVDLKTGRDMILVSKRSIGDQTMSDDMNRIAFVEVEDVEKKYFDKLWICNIRGDSLINLYRGPAKAKTGGKCEIAWSPEGRFVGMFYQPEAMVFEIGNPGNVEKIRGADFSWSESTKIIFSGTNGISRYDVSTHTSEVLMPGATNPKFLLKRNY